MQSGLTLINTLGVIIITPVVAFYLLLDWDGMVAHLRRRCCRANTDDEIRGMLGDIDQAMAGVIRGQGARHARPVASTMASPCRSPGSISASPSA